MSGNVPGAWSLSSHPYPQGYGGGQLMLPAWPPARAGRKTGGEFVPQSRARELLQCPFSPSLHSLCGANPSEVVDQSHGGVPPPETSHPFPPWEGCCSHKCSNGQKYWDFSISLLHSLEVEQECWGGCKREGYSWRAVSPPSSALGCAGRLLEAE